MQHTLKLTITAVGENDSVFLTPCDPVTLHESSIENAEEASEEAEQDQSPRRAEGDGIPAGEGDDVMVMIDE